MTTITNAQDTLYTSIYTMPVVQVTDTSYNSSETSGSLFPFLFAGNQLASDRLPNYETDSIFEKKITKLATKCGQLGTKFSYYLSDDIQSYGNRFSLSQPVVYGPAKDLNYMEEFLLAREFCKIKDPKISGFACDLFLFCGLPLPLAGVITATFIDHSLILGVSLISAAAFLALGLIFEINASSPKTILLRDLQAAEAIGFEKAIHALETFKEQKQNVRLFGLPKEPSYDKRISMLKSYQYIHKTDDSKSMDESIQ